MGNFRQKAYVEALRALQGPGWLRDFVDLAHSYAQARSEEERSELRLAYYALLDRLEPRSGEALLLAALFVGLRTAEALDEGEGTLAGGEGGFAQGEGGR